MPDHLRMRVSNFLDAVHQHRLEPRCIARQILIDNFLQTRQRRRATNRIARMRARHRPGGICVHYLGPADHARQRQRTAHPLAKTDQIRHHAVMHKPPHLACAPEPGLHLVENQQGPVRLAPLGQSLHVRHRREIRPHSLIRFQHHPAHIVCVHPLGGEGSTKKIKIHIFRPIPVRKRHLHNRGVFVSYPILLPGDAADLLRA